MTSFFAVVAFVIFIIGLAKGGFGGTLGALATPLLTFVLPVDQVLGLVLLIYMVGDIFAVAAHWNHWNLQLALLLFPGAIVGMTIASFLIAVISPEALRRGIGIVILIFAIYELFKNSLERVFRYSPRTWHGLLAGVIGGFTSTMANAGGPPIAVYLLLQNVQPRVFVATAALFFALFNFFKIPSYIYLDLFNFDLLWQVAWLLPLLPLGVWIGKVIANRINKKLFDWIILAILSGSALLLLFR